jgi:hypothetical protein
MLQDLRFSEAVKIQFQVFWVAMLCSVVIGYQRTMPPASSGSLHLKDR